MYINKIFLYGNLTRDPELKSLPSGRPVANFGLATNRRWKDQEGRPQESVEFHNLVAFGKPAELVAQYMRKGKALFVEGRLQTRSWDGPDGQKRSRTEIIVENFQFGPRGGGGNDGAPNNSHSSSQNASESKEEVDSIEYPQEDIKTEDIPF